jgi:hypothetical protein
MQHTFVTARCVITVLIALIIMFAGPMEAFATLDAVFANRDQPNQACLRDGSGFTCAKVSPAAVTTRSRAVALSDPFVTLHS